MGRGGRSAAQRPRFVSVVPHVAIFYSTGVEHCSSVRYCLRFRLDFPKNNWLFGGPYERSSSRGAFERRVDGKAGLRKAWSGWV